MEHWYDLWNTIVIVMNFCNAKKMICVSMFIISYHYGIKCLRNLLQKKIYAKKAILQKSIAIKMEFHISYQCAIMSEMTLNIILHGFNYNSLLWHFIP